MECGMDAEGTTNISTVGIILLFCRLRLGQTLQKKGSDTNSSDKLGRASCQWEEFLRTMLAHRPDLGLAGASTAAALAVPGVS